MKQDKFDVITHLQLEDRLRVDLWSGQVAVMKKNRRGWMSQNLSGGGYLFFTTSYHGQIYRIYCHEVIATLAGLNVIDDTERLIINHINGNKTDNRFNNLEMMTMSENTEHAWRTGLFKSRQDKQLKEQENLI